MSNDSPAVPSVYVDGIASIATHNGVHRIVFYKLSSDGKPDSAVEILTTDSSLALIDTALKKLRK